MNTYPIPSCTHRSSRTCPVCTSCQRKMPFFLNVYFSYALKTKYETCTANATQLIKAHAMELFLYQRLALPDVKTSPKALPLVF